MEPDMLPMLFSFLGAGLAKTGALGSFLANPLIAGSVGAGLGRFAETGKLEEGVKAGIGSFLGGTALGAVGNALGGGAGAGAGAGAGTGGVLIPPPRPAGLGVPGFKAPPVENLSGSMLKDVFSGGMQFGQSAQGIGSLAGAALASPQRAATVPQGTPPDLTKINPMQRTLRAPPMDYRPGVDPEFDYGISQPYTSEYFTRRYADGGTVKKTVPGFGVVRLQAGGIASIAPETETEPSQMAGGNEKTVIVEAIRAIKDMHPQPEMALAAFVQTYGEDALRDLVDRVQSGEFDETVERFADGEKGEVRGPGDGSGTDDMVPATIDGEQDVLLSDGEFVVRKDSTDALENEFGAGFMDRLNKAGTRAPEAVREMVMQ